MALSSTRQHFSLRYSFFQAQSNGSRFSWKWNFFKIPKAFFSFIQCLPQKIQVSAFGHNLGCAAYTQNWVFFQNFQNTAFLLLYYSAREKATTMVFIGGDRGYPAVRFEYKTASERYSVTEI